MLRIFHLVNQLKRSLGNDDVMIIFDTKGDYYNSFYNPYSDNVISTSSVFQERASIWNIFNEILFDASNQEEIAANV